MKYIRESRRIARSLLIRAWPLVCGLQLGCVLDFSDLSGGGGGGGGSATSVTTGGNCLEGCPGGACAPVATPDDPQLPVFRVGAAAGRVVIADPTNAELVVVDGGGEARIGALAAPQAVAIHEDRVFFATASQGLFSCSLPACDDLAELVPMGPSTFARQLVADDRQVYWITGPDLSDGAVYRVSVNGGAVELVADGQVRPHGLAVDGERIYWTVHETGNDDGLVRSAPKDGGPATDVLTGLRAPSGLAVAGDDLFFTSSAFDGAVYRASKTGGAPELVTDGPVPVNDPIAQPASVAVVGNEVIWSNDGGGSVMACPQAGCSENDAGQPIILARELTGPGGLVANGACVAWGAGEGIFATQR